MPQHPTTDQVVELVARLMLPFHEIKRQHKLPIGRRSRESDVEHSWTVSVLACALAPQISPHLDVGKIAQFALVHDLTEVYAGDTKIFSGLDTHRASKAERERDALYKLRQDYNAFPWLAGTIAEYESFESEEAKFVYAVDKYIAVVYDLLDHGAYLRQLGIDKPKYDEIMTTHRTKAHRHPGVGIYYDAVRKLIDEQPEFLQAAP